MNTLARSVVGMALAAGAVYFFDPVSGHRRRLILRDQCMRAAHRLDDGTRRTRQDLSYRAQELTTRFKSDQPSDKKLTARIRDALDGTVSYPKAIAVAVHEGRVILRGDVYTHELDSLLDAVRSVPGVRVITDHLTTRERAEGIRRRYAEATNGRSLAPSVFLGATACGLLFWGVKERKALGAWGQNLWRVSRHEVEDFVARVKHTVETEAKRAENIVGEAAAHEDVADYAPPRPPSDLGAEARSHVA